jgi:hypothetical protein
MEHDMEPPASDGDALSPVPTERQPRTSIPSTIGILNIIFGSLLLLCSFCSGVNLLVQSAMGGPIMAMQQQQMQLAMRAPREQRMAQLKAREEAAKDEKEKLDLKAQQKAIEAQPVPKMPNFNKLVEDPSLQGFTIVDVLTGFVLNVLMIFSGIALLYRKQWGRITAIWVAAFKIILLIALYTFYALVVVPAMVASFNTMFQEMFDEMQKAAPPGQKMPGAAELAQFGTLIGVASTATAVFMIIFGSIYPVIVLILLTRPRVKAACSPPPPPSATMG